MFQSLARHLLKKLSRAVVEKYQPKIIGITGSVGKTTTKEAILLVLSKKYRVRGNIKNYNNEIGLPLTILGSISPGRSPLGWVKVIIRALGLLIFRDKNYPEFLVLEMGVDHPRDMDYLLSVAQPIIGVVTVIGQAHLEFFGTPDSIAEEKSKLVASLPSSGIAILNADDRRVAAMASKCKGKVITYGLGPEAQVRATEVSFNYRQANKLSPEALVGINCELHYQESVVPLSLPLVMTEAALYSVLAAAAVGLSQDLGLIEIADILKDFQPLRGRFNLLPGVDGSVVIDDSYNASPTSMIAALEILANLPVDNLTRRIAVLGDMLELGLDSPAEHRRVGQVIAGLPIGHLILVGPLAKLIGEEAQSLGWSGELEYFNNSSEAALKIKEIISAPAAILVKGSQGARMERLVKELLANPQEASKYLVRQDGRWLANS